MSLKYWAILAVLHATVAFTVATRREFSVMEICELLQRYYQLLHPLFYGFEVDFKKDLQDRNLQGAGRISPTSDLTITDCKSRRILPDNSSMAVTATIKDEAMMIIFDDRPWVELIKPVVKIAMKSEHSDRFRKVTVSSVDVHCDKALVNKTSLDEHATMSVRNILALRLRGYSFQVRHQFAVEEKSVSEAFKEMMQFYLYRLIN